MKIRTSLLYVLIKYGVLEEALEEGHGHEEAVEAYEQLKATFEGKREESRSFDVENYEFELNLVEKR